METMQPIAWDGQKCRGWLLSEKYDGIRAIWDGDTLWTRGGHPINPPAWWTETLPKTPLDGELYTGKGCHHVSGITRRKVARDEDWREVRFMVFDLPTHGGAFVMRSAGILDAIRGCPVAHAVTQRKVSDSGEGWRIAAEIHARGGEGAVIRDPRSLYRLGYSDRALKLKFAP